MILRNIFINRPAGEAALTDPKKRLGKVVKKSKPQKDTINALTNAVKDGDYGH